MIACIFGRVQWRWALDDGPAPRGQARCGFVGVMFCRVLAEAAPLVDIEFPPNVGARGILGIDELRYNRI